MGSAGPLTALRACLDRIAPSARVNFWCHALEGSFWSLGDSLVSAAEVLPVLAVSGLGASGTALGVLNALAGTALLAPLIVAHRVEAAARKKRLVVLLGLGGRLPYLAIAGALALFGASRPAVALIVIGVCILAKSLLMSVSVPPWTDLVAETIPHQRTGRLFGYRMSLSALMGLVAGPICAAIVAGLGFPRNYVMLYEVSFAALLISLVIFALVDEMPADAAPAPAHPARHYLRELLTALRRDATYRNFLIYRALSQVRLATMPFYAMAAMIYHGMDEALVVGSFIVVRRLATIVGTLVGPRLAERIGHRHVMQAGAALAILSALVAAFAPAGAWALFVGAVFVGSLGGSAEMVTRWALSLRIYPRGRRVGYTTLSMAALTPAAIIAAPAAGWVMDVWGHAALFCLAAIVMAASLLPLHWCRPSERELSARAEGWVGRSPT